MCGKAVINGVREYYHYLLFMSQKLSTTELKMKNLYVVIIFIFFSFWGTIVIQIAFVNLNRFKVL